MGKSITKEEIAQFEIEEFTGNIVIVETLKDAEKAVEHLSGYDILGFDTETRPAFKKGTTNEVALIQLSTDETCFLFRLNKIGFPPSLIRLLSDPCILKIGLSLRDDFMTIRRKYPFEPAGFIDLQKLMPQYDIDDISLQKIYALIFGKKISKNQRLTNWEADELSEAQKKYAALDAWACLKIYKHLCLTKKSI
ncbi:3'-5' exonuclease domain-containing protein 2 [Bacteroidales bacterium OttesenSCG-928-J19]|nr:3'-5' exonuclease domain-containing protein 2 [Bacteroidales bacterium OttesenSCG-928-J19]